MDLARYFCRGPHGSPDSAIQRITQYAAMETPGAQYAGITLATSRTSVATPATTHPYPALLDVIQQRHGEGPCLSAAWHQHTVRIDDLSTDDRWPRYRCDALKVTPIRSILCFRLFTSDHTMGTLNVYANKPKVFDDDAEEVGYVLATHAALAWDMVPREAQSLSALATRDVIGQAKGIVMARFDMSAVQAFELLKRLSQETNTELVDAARHLTAEFDHS